MKKFKFHQKKVLFLVIFITLITPIYSFGNFKSPPSPPPTNDDCLGALYILPTAATCSYTTYDNIGATSSTGIPAPGCVTFSGGDVWFQVLVPVSGHLIFDSQAGTMTNGVMAIYSGNCGALTLIQCDDNSSSNTNMPMIDKNGLPPYSVIFIRFWGKNNTYGTFGLCVYEPTPPPVQPPCTNLGFENDFTGWYGTVGDPVTGPTGAISPSYIVDTYNTTADPNFTIMTGSGVDPYGNFPVVYPGGGTKSLRLGNKETYQTHNAASIEQTFQVTSNSNFTYHIAVVLVDPSHDPNEQPFFRIDFYDQNNNPITCAQYQVTAPGTNFLISSIEFSGYPVHYKPWFTVSANLIDYIGQNVTIRFTASDCSLGAHPGYAYIDCECQQAYDITGADTVCSGHSATITAPAGATGYLWSPGGATTQSITVSPTTTTTYSCIVSTMGNTTCHYTLTHKVNIASNFTAIASNNSPICLGDTLKLDATPVGAPFYSWTGPNGFTSSIKNPFIANVTSADSGTYTATVKNALGCSATANTNVVIHPLPTIITTNDSVCIGDTATISASGGVIYEWSNGLINSTINVAPLATTAYQVKVTDQYGCKDTSSAKAVIHPIPIIQISPNTSVCLGSQTTLTATGGVSYLWNTSPTDTNSYNVVTPTDSVTTYKVIVTDINKCVDSATVDITTIPLPTPTISNEIDTLCKGSYTTITAGGGTSFLWNTGEVTPSISVRPLTSTVYNVTVKNIICSKDTSILQLVRNCYVIYIPNAFIPTGYNTVFKPIGEIGDPKTYQFAIYNRWGGGN